MQSSWLESAVDETATHPGSAWELLEISLLEQLAEKLAQDHPSLCAPALGEKGLADALKQVRTRSTAEVTVSRCARYRSQAVSPACAGECGGGQAAEAAVGAAGQAARLVRSRGALDDGGAAGSEAVQGEWDATSAGAAGASAHRARG
eukprot:3899228-Prymnesium_polylepis.1